MSAILLPSVRATACLACDTFFSPSSRISRACISCPRDDCVSADVENKLALLAAISLPETAPPLSSLREPWVSVMKTFVE